MLRAEELRAAQRRTKSYSSTGALHDEHAHEQSFLCCSQQVWPNPAASLPERIAGRRSEDSVLLPLSSSVASAASDAPTSTCAAGARATATSTTSPRGAADDRSSLWDDLAGSDSGEEAPGPNGQPQALDTLLGCLLTLQQQLHELDSENSALRAALSDQRGLMAHVQQALLEQQPAACPSAVACDAMQQPHGTPATTAARVDAACECHIAEPYSADAGYREHSMDDAHAYVHSLRPPSAAALTLRAAQSAATSLAGQAPSTTQFEWQIPAVPPGTPIGGLDIPPYFPPARRTPSSSSWTLPARTPSVSAPGGPCSNMQQQQLQCQHARCGGCAGRATTSHDIATATDPQLHEVDDVDFSWYLPEQRLAEIFRLGLRRP